MNQIFSRLSTRNWLFYVTLMCFLLGALLAANLNTQGSIRAQLGMTDVGATRLPWLMGALREQRNTNDDLRKTISGLRQQLASLEDSQSKHSAEAHTLVDELQQLRLLVGLTPVEGPGVILTLNDNRSKKIGDPNSDLYIVHDYDLRNVVNEMFAAGAEAIAINDHRIVGRTAIRCVGPSTMINGEPTGAPFVIKAIGSPHDLEGALNIPNGILDILRLGLIVKMESSDNIQIGAFTGATNFKYAKPLPVNQ